jgi:hypothetical protein
MYKKENFSKYYIHQEEEGVVSVWNFNEQHKLFYMLENRKGKAHYKSNGANSLYKHTQALY